MALLGVMFLHFALLISGADSGTVIRGRILDPERAVISKATICVLDESSRRVVKTAVSDADGGFAAEGLAPGRYLLAVSAKGFAEKLLDIGPLPKTGSLFRTIQLDVLDCDAPHVNCDIFTAGPYTDPHPILMQRDLTVGIADAVDLDKGVLVPFDSRAADLRLSVEGGGLYLLPLNKASFAARGKDGGCGKAAGKPQPDRIDGLGPGSEIIMRTNHGRCAKIFVTQEIPPGADQAAFKVVTRAR